MNVQYGWTALMLAAYAGRYAVCKTLLDHGANSSVATSNGKTAYVLAREAGSDDVIALLAEHQHTSASEVGITLRYGVAESVVSGAGNAYPAALGSTNTDGSQPTNHNTPVQSGLGLAAATTSGSSGQLQLPGKPLPVGVNSAISGSSGSQVTEMRSAVSNRTRASGPVSRH
jgi:hypothetical protein